MKRLATAAIAAALAFAAPSLGSGVVQAESCDGRGNPGRSNNWCRDWYWSGFYGYCAREDVDRDPVLDDDLRKKLGLPLSARSDRGGGFATSFGCWEVLSATGRLSWPPMRRQLWNGFRCVVEL